MSKLWVVWVCFSLCGQVSISQICALLNQTGMGQLRVSDVPVTSRAAIFLTQLFGFGASSRGFILSKSSFCESKAYSTSL